MELMKQSKIMHFISTTKYTEEYLQLIENKYTTIKEVFKI